MAKTHVHLRPWSHPNFATATAGINGELSIPIAELQQEALDELAQEWLVDLYTDAGKINPFRCERLAREKP